MPTEFADIASDLTDSMTISIETPTEPGTEPASPTAADSSSTSEHWKPTGRCSFCLMEIETDQRAPSEATTRHIVSKLPYLECPPAQRIPTTIGRGGDLCHMQRPKTELHEKLEHYGIDIRSIQHWRYVRETTGGGHRVLDPKWPGEE